MKDILSLLGLEEMNEQEQQTTLLDLQTLIFKGSVVRMLGIMSEDAKDAFNEYLSTNPSEEDMMTYLETNVPGAEQAVLDTIAELKNDILADTQS